MYKVNTILRWLREHYFHIKCSDALDMRHHVDSRIVGHIISAYYRKTIADHLEYFYRYLKEKVFGIDCAVFDKTILYYKEVKNQRITYREALSKALDKKRHKDAWFARKRHTIADIMHFYQEDDFYLFRHPFYHRFGCFRWFIHLLDHIKTPSILEYGCGCAILTEWLSDRFPGFDYTVADIPSVSLDFVKWKKARYNYDYSIKTIGSGKKEFPVMRHYDLIVCKEVLEHTPNPLATVSTLVSCLSPGGVLVVDFINASGGENLEIAVMQREKVKNLLKKNLIGLKPIDEPQGHDGLYIKDYLNIDY